MDEVSRVFRVYVNTCEMLTDRGYFLPEEKRVTSMEEFTTRFCAINSSTGTTVPQRSQLTFLCAKTADPEDILFACFAEERKVGANLLKDITAQAAPQNARVILLVYPDQMSPIARRAVSQVNNTGDLRIEPFQEDELMFNVTKHELVPTHIPLSDVEKKDLLRTFRLRETQLPRMSALDPVARHFGLTRGRVVQIRRPSETAGEYVTYRLVV